MARKYRKIDPRIWSDESFVTLSESEMLFALYVLTCPQCNRIGMFRFSVALASEDLKASTKAIDGRLAKVCDTLNWKWDANAKVIYLPTWWKYNEPENPKHLIGCLKDLADVPSTKLRAEFLTNTRHLPTKLLDTFAIAMGIGTAYQEQEQEQELEQEQEQELRRVSFRPPTIDEVLAYCQDRQNSIDPKAFIDHYTSNGWRVGKAPMRDWQAAVRTWERNQLSFGKQKITPGQTHDPEASKKDPSYGRL